MSSLWSGSCGAAGCCPVRAAVRQAAGARQEPRLSAPQFRATGRRLLRLACSWRSWGRGFASAPWSALPAPRLRTRSESRKGRRRISTTGGRGCRQAKAVSCLRAAREGAVSAPRGGEDVARQRQCATCELPSVPPAPHWLTCGREREGGVAQSKRRQHGAADRGWSSLWRGHWLTCCCCCCCSQIPAVPCCGIASAAAHPPWFA